MLKATVRLRGFSLMAAVLGAAASTHGQVSITNVSMNRSVTASGHWHGNAYDASYSDSAFGVFNHSVHTSTSEYASQNSSLTGTHLSAQMGTAWTYPDRENYENSSLTWVFNLNAPAILRFTWNVQLYYYPATPIASVTRVGGSTVFSRNWNDPLLPWSGSLLAALPAGQYRVNFDLTSGDDSLSATFDVDFSTLPPCSSTDPPAIGQQPVNQWTCPGGTAKFDMAAFCTGSYRWQKNSVDLFDGGHYAGTATNVLTISNVDAADLASYRCVVTSSGGSTASNPATLSADPVISAQPANKTICPGSSATFTVTATCATAYRWQKNTVDLSDGGHYAGTGTASLTVSSTDSNDSASYRCVVSNSLGSTTSGSATLAFQSPGITTFPTYKAACPGSTATFTVVATCASGYRWQKNTVDLSDGGHYAGTATATLSISNVDSTDVASYRCVVSNSSASVNSNAASLSLSSPIITQQPVNTTACPGSNTKFSIAVSAACPATYQWQKLTVNLADDAHFLGTATPMLTINGVTSDDVASYRCVLTNSFGSTNSSSATLALKPDSGGPDTDGDGVSDSCDDCPTVYDPSQTDADGDGAGDACSIEYTVTLPITSACCWQDINLTPQFPKWNPANGKLTGWRVGARIRYNGSMTVTPGVWNPCLYTAYLEVAEYIYPPDSTTYYLYASSDWQGGPSCSPTTFTASKDRTGYSGLSSGALGSFIGAGDIGIPVRVHTFNVMHEYSTTGGGWSASMSNELYATKLVYVFTPPDQDGDFIPDASDNCPSVANPTQADCDHDGKGDACQLAGSLLVSSMDSDSVLAYNSSTGAFSSAAIASDAGGLDYPNGIAVDAAGNIFVASVDSNAVLEYSPAGDFLRSFTGGGLLDPVQPRISGASLLVSSFSSNSVVRFDLATGLPLGALVSSGSGGLDAPAGLLIKPDGHLLVASQHNGKVLEYDGQTGAFLRVAAQGGGLAVPADMLIDAAGNLLVSSFLSDEVLKYAPDGTPLGAFVSAGSGGLDGPQGMARAPGGNLLVSSYFTNQVLEFSKADGSPVDHDAVTPGVQAAFASGGGLNAPTYLALPTSDCNQNGVPDSCEADADGDGVIDACDGCPADAGKSAPGLCGCGAAESSCTRVITAWGSVRTHNGAGDLPIVLNAAATGNGVAGPTVETRQGGIDRIEIDFDGDVTLINASAVTVTGYEPAGGLMGSPTSFPPASVISVDANTIAMTFSPALPDESCYHIELGPSAIGESLIGDADVYVRALTGDASGNGLANLSDACLIQSQVGAGTLVTAGPQYDLDLSGTIDLADRQIAKNGAASPPRQALCP